MAEVGRGWHEFAGRSSPEPVPGRHALCHRGPRRGPGASSHPFAISGISRRPACRAAGRRGGSDAVASSAPASPRRSPKIIPRGRKLRGVPRRWLVNAGWSAPQPPTPHPSGDRPWPPSGRRGLLLWSGASRHGTRPAARDCCFGAFTLLRAGVGAGLADLSFGTKPGAFLLPLAAIGTELNARRSAERADSRSSTSFRAC